MNSSRLKRPPGSEDFQHSEERTNRGIFPECGKETMGQYWRRGRKFSQIEDDDFHFYAFLSSHPDLFSLTLVSIGNFKRSDISFAFI